MATNIRIYCPPRLPQYCWNQASFMLAMDALRTIARFHSAYFTSIRHRHIIAHFHSRFDCHSCRCRQIYPQQPTTNNCVCPTVMCGVSFRIIYTPACPNSPRYPRHHASFRATCCVLPTSVLGRTHIEFYLVLPPHESTPITRTGGILPSCAPSSNTHPGLLHHTRGHKHASDPQGTPKIMSASVQSTAVVVSLWGRLNSACCPRYCP